MAEKANDDQILKEIGLTDPQLRAYIGKLIGFYNGLTPAEQKVFLVGVHALAGEAHKSFKTPITAAELAAFIKAREPAGAPFVCIVEGLGYSGKTP